VSTVKSPDTTKLVKVPTEVTFGCAAVDKVPPRFVAVKVPTPLISPPVIVAVPSVNDVTRTLLDVRVVNLPSELEIETGAVNGPVIFVVFEESPPKTVLPVTSKSADAETELPVGVILRLPPELTTKDAPLD